MVNYPLKKRFWTKIDVNLALKKRQFRNEDEVPDSFERYMLEDFTKRKSNVITDLGYNSKGDFIDAVVEEQRPDRKKKLLLEVLLEHQWATKRSEAVYEVDTSLSNEEFLEQELDDMIEIIDEIKGEYILWISDEETTRTFNDQGEPEFQRIKRANVAVVKPKNAGKIRVRGLKDDEKKIRRRFSKNNSVSEVEPEPAEKEIIERIENLMYRDDAIYVKEVDFESSILPEQSKIRIRNSSGISEDYKEIQNKNIIPTDIISEIDYMKVYHSRLRKTFKLSMEREDSGFEFELSSQNASEKDRSTFSSDLKDEVGIEINKRYEYTSQHERYLFNRLLACSEDAHKRYISKVEDEVEEFVREVTERKWRHKCENAECEKTTFMLGSKESTTCPICQEETERKDNIEVSINDSKIARRIKKYLMDMEPEPRSRSEIFAWNVEGKMKDLDSEGNKKGIISTFNIQEVGVMGNKNKLYFVPVGNFRRPQSVSSKLLNAVYVKYGNSTSSSYNNYGSIDLYELIFGGFNSQDLGRVVSESISKIRNRTMAEAERRYEESVKYMEELESYLETGKDEKKDRIDEMCHSGREFERFVYPILKDMFIESEKLGGSGEADGVINIPRDDNKSYYVGTYDAKRSHKLAGYHMGQKQKDQMSRYIVKEEELDREINRRTSLNNDRQDSHIIISQNFKDNQFGSISDEVKGWYKHLETHPNTDVVFIQFEALLDLYRFYRENWDKITNSKVRAEFNSTVIDSIEESGNDDYALLDESEARKIKEQILKDIKEYT